MTTYWRGVNSHANILVLSMMKYIHALDLALNSTGVCIFTNDGDIIDLLTIDTAKLDETRLKLEKIGKEFKRLIKKYPPCLVVMEKGFIRYNKSSQAVFRVHGVANYIYCNYNQIYYEATSVKKAVTGKGNANKQLVQESVLLVKPGIEFKNYDESDAVAVGLTYFSKEGCNATFNVS